MERIPRARSTCAQCAGTGLEPLMFIEQAGVPPGEDGHNIVYCHTVLSICPACGWGQTEKLQHDCFDFEDVWDQYEWFLHSPEDMSALRKMVAACPAPLSPGCRCPTHRALRDASMELRATCWESPFEAEQHVHRVSLRITGLPGI